MASPPEPDPATRPDSDPGSRLERALALFLAGGAATPADAERLAGEHPDLRDLFESMGANADADPSPHHDEQVLGDYRLVRELGRGGMGVVYEAWQRSLDRRVAVKVLSQALVQSPSAVARFRREAAAAGRLRHPNLVEVYGFGSEDGQHFFAMQLVEGESLHACAGRFREPAAVAALGVQLLEALEHAHAHGLVHRDVKPANILIRACGTAMLTDFGVASDEALPSLTRDGGFVGTLDYASPEQIRGEAVDTRTDLWAAGVVLCELLAGVHPFAGPTQHATFQNILTREPPVLLGRTGVSRDLAAVVARALAKDRAHRYVSAGAMLADLRAVQAGKPVSARLPTTGERLVRWVRRERWQAAALAILAVGLAAAGGLYVLADRRADENEALALGEAQAKQAFAAKVRDYDLLAGVVLCDQAVAREAALYPAVPEKAAALAGWLADDCAKLEQLRPAITTALDGLRAAAQPIADDAATTADRSALSLAEAQLAELDHALAIRAGRLVWHEPEVPAAQRSLDAAALNQFAWERSSPRESDRSGHGEAELAVACARLAVARAAGQPGEFEFSDTLAWALLLGGQDDAARAASDHALQLAPAERRTGFQTQRAMVEAACLDREVRRAPLLAEIADLRERLATRRSHRCADDATQFLLDTLSRLQQRIDRLLGEQKPRVARRLAWAQRIGELTRQHPLARVTWAAARSALAAADDVQASQLYRGCELPLTEEQVVGLVPIGMNPVTKLWEFYDLRSAWDGVVDPATLPIPSHATDGGIAVGDATGIVFVLLPGGEFAMGSQAGDPQGPNFDPAAEGFMAVQTLRLAPFFVARHELTQGQWARLYDGDERLRYPSGWQVGVVGPNDLIITARYPVGRISWNSAVLLLGQQGLALPTEAQWEYACRGGTSTPYWCGETSASLAGCANLSDAASLGQLGASGDHEVFDDGCELATWVGRFRANPFGLFDAYGNVAEWCRDAPAPNTFGFLPGGEGARRPGMRAGDRSTRGGSYLMTGSRSRSAMWSLGPTDVRAVDLGLRPIRRLRDR